MINTMNTLPSVWGPMLTLQENWDPMLIADWESTKYNSSLYQDYPMEAFPMFQGDFQQFGIWRQGLSHVMGLSDFSAVARSRAPGTNAADDPGVNACDNYTPKVLSGGGNEIWKNELSRALLASQPICVNDLRTQTMGREQIALKVNFFMAQTKEYGIAYRRENAIRAIIRANHGYLMNNAAFNPALSVTDNHFYYDAETLVDGVPCLYYKAGDEVGTLNIDVLINQTRWLGAQCPDGATGSVDGMPSFTWYGDAQDLENAIRQDPAAREDFRYAEPTALMGSFRKFRSYRGVTIAHDLTQMRFKEVGIVVVSTQTEAGIAAGTSIANGRGGYLPSGNWIRCARVNPERESDRTGVDGFKVVEANPEYFTAPLRLLPAIMNNVMTIQVGSKLETLPGGMVFGPQPGYNGEVKFLVYPENELNPFGEKGAFFCRYELGIKPGKNYMNSVGYLYRSCQQNIVTRCVTDGTSTAAVALAAAVDTTDTAANTDISLANSSVIVRLASAIKVTNGSVVTVTQGNETETGYIFDATMAPTYVIGFAAAAFTSVLGLSGAQTSQAAVAAKFTTATTVQVA